MLNPFINLVGDIISLLDLILMVWLVLDILINLDIINRHNPLMQRIYFSLGKVVEPMLRPIRHLTSKYLPDFGGIDISPVILLLLLHFLKDALYTWFYTIP